MSPSPGSVQQKVVHCDGNASETGLGWREVDLTTPEQRVLGCLLEKQRTTPDAYPLTLNALRLACNQSTNRDPVVSYDDDTIKDAVARLARRRWVRFASGHGSRAAKYRHLLDEALGLGPAELALLCLLLLRGPQTPGELKGRSERLHQFPDLAAVEATLEALIGRGLTVQLDRRPGQKEERYAHLLGEAEAPAPAATPVPGAPPPPPPAPAPTAPAPRAAERGEWDDGLALRVSRLEDEVAQLRAAVDALRAELGA
jgi:uncharacterized protein YceH (UPF0502 family)